MYYTYRVKKNPLNGYYRVLLLVVTMYLFKAGYYKQQEVIMYLEGEENGSDFSTHYHYIQFTSQELVTIF